VVHLKQHADAEASCIQTINLVRITNTRSYWCALSFSPAALW
jgi:hypothetical protein